MPLKSIQHLFIIPSPTTPTATKRIVSDVDNLKEELDVILNQFEEYCKGAKNYAFAYLQQIDVSRIYEKILNQTTVSRQVVVGEVDEEDDDMVFEIIF
jgi:hypothetical protein